MQAIILAGGEGKRMGSILPKVLHEVGGKPMLQRIMERVLSLGVVHAVVVCGRNSKMFEVSMKPVIDLLREGVIVKFVDQVPALGTGHAVLAAMPHLDKSTDMVLIVNGDAPLIGDCLAPLVDAVGGGGKTGILATRLDYPFGQGRIVLDDAGVFRGIVEEKDCTDEEKKIDLVNCGVYLVSKRDLEEFLPLVGNNNAQKEYYLTDFFGLVVGAGGHVKVFEVPKESQWQLLNVNTPSDLEWASEVYSHRVALSREAAP